MLLQDIFCLIGIISHLKDSEACGQRFFVGLSFSSFCHLGSLFSSQANATRISGLAHRTNLDLCYDRMSSAWRRSQLLLDPAAPPSPIAGSSSKASTRTSDRLVAGLRAALTARSRVPLPLPDAPAKRSEVSSDTSGGGQPAAPLPAYKLTRRMGERTQA
jgi:hypothetical protein